MNYKLLFLAVRLLTIPIDSTYRLLQKKAREDVFCDGLRFH